MVAQRARVLISYKDNNSGSSTQDFVLANQLANHLRGNGFDADTMNYSTSSLSTNAYQWLILIPSPEIVQSTSMNNLVDTALEQVVKRRMKGVLAVTANTSDLPPKWATIRKYEANDALEGLLRAMKYAKNTYPEAQALAQSQQGPMAAFRRQQPLRVRLALLGAALLIIFAATFGSFQFLSNRSSQGTLSPSNLTATVRADEQNLATFLKNIAQASPTPTSQTKGQDYTSIMKMSPTITDFRTADHWSTASTDTPNCKLTGSTYAVSIQDTTKYTVCLSELKYTNFALQVTMDITNGDAGGVIFRDDGNGTYYRLAFNQSDQSTPNADTYSVYLCNKNCDNNLVGAGTQLETLSQSGGAPSVQVDRSKPIPFTVIVSGNTIDLYYKTSLVEKIVDKMSKTTLTGRIGVFAAMVGSGTDVTFSNLKIWSLDKS